MLELDRYKSSRPVPARRRERVLVCGNEWGGYKRVSSQEDLGSGRAQQMAAPPSIVFFKKQRQR